MREIAKLLKEQNLDQATLTEIKQFFKLHTEVYNKFNSFWKKLDPYYSKNIQYKTIHTIAAYPEIKNIEELILHINQFLIDSEGEVSPSKFIILNKINHYFNDIIMSATRNLPKKMTLTGRCELLRNGIFELPKCANCNNHVSWYNSSKLLTYCSKECGDNSSASKEKRNATMTNLYGSESYTQTKEFQVKAKKTKKEKYGNENYTNREQAMNTWIDIYGVDNPLKDDAIRNRIKATMKENHGVENYVEHPDFKNKSEKTCMEHFGFRHQAQSPEIYKKIQNSLFTVKQFENTKLNYQGSYELYFLELMNQKELISEIFIPGTVNYTLNNNTHVYNPDFEFRGKIIEIKSSWTYNKNGVDKELENKNHAKWNAVKITGKEIIILKSKKEIKKFIDSLLATS